MQGLQSLNQFKDFVSSIGGLGRYEDTYIVHAAEGETVVPMEVLDQNPVLKKRLFKTMMDMGIEPGRYIVGNELNSKNPVTGQPEFFLKKIGRRLRKAAADISGYAAPIIGAMYGPAAGAAAGALLGQYKRENPGDPNQGMQMALRGGMAGIGSNIAGGADNIFTGTGMSAKAGGFSPMKIFDYYKDPKNFKGYFKGDNDKSNIRNYIEKFMSKGDGKTDQLSIKEEAIKIFNEYKKNDMPISGDRAIEMAEEKLKSGMSLGQLASLYGLGTAGLGFLLDKTTDDQDIGLPADTMPEGQVKQGIVNPLLKRAQGGVMDLQDGGESKGPGTGTSDSIPAMLSDGEFVMTAKAVRGAGGGDRREGAKKMYEAMDNLEARA